MVANYNPQAPRTEFGPGLRARPSPAPAAGIRAKRGLRPPYAMLKRWVSLSDLQPAGPCAAYAHHLGVGGRRHAMGPHAGLDARLGIATERGSAERAKPRAK
jgi:hypothetical protein